MRRASAIKVVIVPESRMVICAERDEDVNPMTASTNQAVKGPRSGGEGANRGANDPPPLRFGLFSHRFDNHSSRRALVRQD